MPELYPSLLNRALHSTRLRMLAALFLFLTSGIEALKNWGEKIGLNLPEEELLWLHRSCLPLLLVLFLVAGYILFSNELKNSHAYKNPQKFIDVLNAARTASQNRQYVNVERIDELKSSFNENKLYLDPSTEQTVKNVISHLCVIQTYSEEVKDTKLSDETKRAMSNKILESCSALDKEEKHIEMLLRNLNT
jgi:hypothetical protein